MKRRIFFTVTGSYESDSTDFDLTPQEDRNFDPINDQPLSVQDTVTHIIAGGYEPDIKYSFSYYKK